jgi:hypothetical protein
VFLFGLQTARSSAWSSGHTSREAAEQELAVILADEPEWSELLEIVRVDFGGAEVRVERA